MKLTEEQKQKIKDYFESMSEEEVMEILKGHLIDVAKKESIEERMVGEIFKFEGKKLQVVKSKTYTCDGCFFNRNNVPCVHQNISILGACDKKDRSDNNYVKFVKV